MTTGKFIYIRKAAQELCCTERHIYDLIKSGKLKAIRLGPRGLRVQKCSVDKYIKKNIYKAQKRKR
jgi:excisionase family DNA binding protein